MFKINKKNARAMSVDINKQLIDIVLGSFFLTLNLFCFLGYFFLSEIWTSECELEILLIRAGNHEIFQDTLKAFNDYKNKEKKAWNVLWYVNTQKFPSFWTPSCGWKGPMN